MPNWTGDDGVDDFDTTDDSIPASPEHRCTATGCKRRLSPFCTEHRTDVVPRQDYETLKEALTAAPEASKLRALRRVARAAAKMSKPFDVGESWEELSRALAALKKPKKAGRSPPRGRLPLEGAGK